MKRMWIVGVLVLGMAVTPATPAGAAGGGNSANAKLCQKDGWQTLSRSSGTTFATQGECVSYGAKGGSITTNQWQARCEENGGTFSLENHPFEPPPAFQYVCERILDHVWFLVLNPLCLSYPDYHSSVFSSVVGQPGSAECRRTGT